MVHLSILSVRRTWKIYAILRNNVCFYGGTFSVRCVERHINYTILSILSVHRSREIHSILRNTLFYGGFVLSIGRVETHINGKRLYSECMQILGNLLYPSQYSWMELFDKCFERHIIDSISVFRVYAHLGKFTLSFVKCFFYEDTFRYNFSMFSERRS